MYNDLFTIGKFTVHGYGLMIAIGVVACVLLCEYAAKKRGLDSDIVYVMAPACVIFGFFCAKILHIIVEWKSFIQNPLSYLTLNGFVVYGGIIGGTFAAYVILKIKKYRFIDYFDIVLPAVCVAQAFGRIGCFLAGCCHGKETDSWIGIAFTNSLYAPNGVKLIPTQLISSAGLFVIAGICYWYLKRNPRPGRVGALYMILYSIGRAFIEQFRADARGEVGFLSTSQFISIFILALGIAIFALAKPRKEEPESNKE